MAFSRESGDSKIAELLDLFGLADRLLVNEDDYTSSEIDFEMVHRRIQDAKIDSLNFLKKELDGVAL